MSFLYVCFSHRGHTLSMQNGRQNMEKFLGELYTTNINDWH